MLSLRSYRNEDAGDVASWLTNETEFIWWSAGKMGAFPLDPQRLNAFYAEGVASGDWFPKVMEEDGRVCGQMLMRWKDKEAGGLHFGFIVVDGSQRGKGLGFAMLSMALEYAFHIKRAAYVTLNVFADNAPAIRCYERLGFVRVKEFDLEADGQKRPAYVYEKRRNHG